MGKPDFDLDLNSFPEGRAPQVPDLIGKNGTGSGPAETISPKKGLGLVERVPPMKFLSRSFRGFKFTPLPSAAEEARSVAKLLGDDAVLKLGAEAREAELKAVVSPRVLHLATHGFFLSDQELKHTNSMDSLDSFVRNSGTRWNASLPQNDWENPLVRYGIALAGANHATNLVGSSRREEALTSTSHLSTTNSQPGVQSLLTSAATRFDAEDGVLTGLEASLLNLQGTELVILSACDSGSGEVKIGEGVMSLRRAFRIKGAESVLASHWKVSDKGTSELMTEFMRRWRRGNSLASGAGRRVGGLEFADEITLSRAL